MKTAKKNSILLLATFVLCGFITDPVGAQTTGAGEKTILGVPSPALSMLPVFIAQDRGFFKKEGIEPVIVHMGGRLQALALASAEIDYTASVETALRAAIQGMPFKVVVYTSAKMSVSLVTTPEIKSVADLRGRAIAVTSLGGGLEYALREILAKLGGLNPDREVRIVALSMTDQMLGLTSGSLQGAMLVPPFDAIMAKKGFKSLVFAGDIMDFPQGGLATTDKKIKERPSQVKKIVRATVNSLIHIRENRDELVSYIANRWKIDTELAASSYQIMVRSFSRDGTASPRSIQNVIDSTRARLKIERPTAISDLINLSLLEEVHREMGIK